MFEPQTWSQSNSCHFTNLFPDNTVGNLGLLALAQLLHDTTTLSVLNMSSSYFIFCGRCIFSLCRSSVCGTTACKIGGNMNLLFERLEASCSLASLNCSCLWQALKGLTSCPDAFVLHCSQRDWPRIGDKSRPPSREQRVIDRAQPPGYCAQITQPFTICGSSLTPTDTSLDDSDFRTLFASLAHNTSLESLKCPGQLFVAPVLVFRVSHCSCACPTVNSVTDVSRDAALAMLQTNTTMTQLDLSCEAHFKQSQLSLLHVLCWFVQGAFVMNCSHINAMGYLNAECALCNEG